MHFEGESAISVPREKVWEYISDPRNGPEYVTNIEGLEVISKDKFTAKAGVGIAGIEGALHFDFEIVENIPPGHARFKASGKGVRSFLNFETQIDLSETQDGETEMKWMIDAEIGGLIEDLAGLELSRMLADVKIKDIFERLKGILEKGA